LRYFARIQALSVVHLWTECPPDVVLDFLMTGDESLRAAAGLLRGMLRGLRGLLRGMLRGLRGMLRGLLRGLRGMLRGLLRGMLSWMLRETNSTHLSTPNFPQWGFYENPIPESLHRPTL
jgi:hypothetical protein